MRLRLESYRTTTLVILLPLHFAAAQASWTRVGEASEWTNTTVVTTMNGMFWSVEANGSLYWTSPYGGYGLVGQKGDYSGTTQLVALDGILFSVQNGTMYYTDIKRNAGARVGSEGSWRNTLMISPMNSYLWSIESNGDIYKTDEQGSYRLIGRFNGARFFAAMGGKLWVIDDEGTLQYVAPGDNRWQVAGNLHGFTRTIRLVTSPDYLWTLDNEGNMWRGDSNGSWSQFGATGEFKNVSDIVVLKGHLYAIRYGSLYLTH